MKLKKPILSGLLAFTLAANLITPALAYNSTGSTTDQTTGEDTAQSAWTEYYNGLNSSSAETDIYMTRSSTFTVLIPKTIILSGADGTAQYVVGAKGDVLLDNAVRIEPNNYEIDLQRKDDASNIIKADIEQVKKQVTGADIQAVVPAYATMEGSIKARELKAGSWKSKVIFNISLIEDLTTDSSHTHTWTHVPAVEATETTPGNIEYWYCAECGKYYSDANGEHQITQGETVIEPIEHTHNLTHVEETNSTYEYWYCESCGKYFSDASGTTEIEQADTVKPVQGHEHNLTYMQAMPASTTAPANKDYWYCGECDKYFSDEAGTTEIGKYDIYNGLVDFTVTSGIESKVGLIGSANEALTIPDMFRDADGTWYKVTSIDANAFSTATNLGTVTIPETVTSIGEGAFKNCTSLKKFIVNPNNPNYSSNEDGMLLSKDGTTLIQFPNDATGRKLHHEDSSGSLLTVDDAYNVPEGITTIGAYAFANSNLKRVELPNTVTVIEKAAFENCANLDWVFSGNSIQTIGADAFYDCGKLKLVTLPDNSNGWPSSLKTIGNYAFSGCTAFNGDVDSWRLFIPSGVTEIGYMAFQSVPEVVYSGTLTSPNNWGAESISRS